MNKEKGQWEEDNEHLSFLKTDPEKLALTTLLSLLLSQLTCFTTQMLAPNRLSSQTISFTILEGKNFLFSSKQSRLKRLNGHSQPKDLLFFLFLAYYSQNQ